MGHIPAPHVLLKRQEKKKQKWGKNEREGTLSRNALSATWNEGTKKEKKEENLKLSWRKNSSKSNNEGNTPK